MGQPAAATMLISMARQRVEDVDSLFRHCSLGPALQFIRASIKIISASLSADFHFDARRAFPERGHEDWSRVALRRLYLRGHARKQTISATPHIEA